VPTATGIACSGVEKTMHTYNPSTQEADPGPLRVQGQVELHSKFPATVGYRERQDERSDLCFVSVGGETESQFDCPLY
jgi:hypothetical protein